MDKEQTTLTAEEARSRRQIKFAVIVFSIVELFAIILLLVKKL